MLGDQKTQESIGRNNNAYNIETEHDLIISWTPSNEKKFYLKRRFGSPRMLNKSIPRRNRKNLFRYRMTRSLNLESSSSTRHNSLRSPNMNSNNCSFDMNESSRELSRSAKIMRALSFNCNSFHHRNINIKKSLNFDLTPSPKKYNDFDGNTTTGSKISTPPLILDKFLKSDTSSTDCSPSSILIASSQSIDENQNQTPQQNWKLAKMSNRIKNVDKSEPSGSSLILQGDLNEKSGLSKKISNAQTPDLESLKCDNKLRLRAFGYMAVSTPRNLFHDFNEDGYYRSCTPENTTCLIPESMSSIKKSHKKERLHRHRKQSFAEEADIFIRDSYPRRATESLEIDDALTNCNTASIKPPQSRDRNIKKTLLYNSENELSDIESISDYTCRQTDILREENNLSVPRSSQLKDNKIESIDSNDLETCNGNMQDNIHFEKYNDNERERTDENARDEKECRLHLQETSSHASNVENTIDEDGTISPESNQAISQDFNVVSIPESHINYSQHVLTESIKKSHKRIKAENRKTLYTPKILYHKMEITGESAQNSYDHCNNTIKSKSTDATCILQNLPRPSTPKDVNSSRLLLPLYNSVKKSHKKDKLNRIARFVKDREYHENHTKDLNSLQNDGHKTTNSIKNSCKNDSYQLEESARMSPDKTENLMNILLQNDTQELSKSPKSLCLEHENVNNQFNKTYTPIKRRIFPNAIANYVCTEGTSAEKGERIQTISKEIDFSKCMTPIPDRLEEKRPGENEYLMRCVNTKFEDKIYGSEKITDTTNLTSKNGRSTPVNMRTSELLCKIDSIKKSHRKDKYSCSIYRKRISEKKQMYIKKERGNVKFASDREHLEKCSTPSLNYINIVSHCAGTEMCSDTCDIAGKNYRETLCDETRPSTSRGTDNIENARNGKESKYLNTTPPNCLETSNFIKQLHTISIKRSHKKERKCNAQAKYILMAMEDELSDDGSIFDEEDRLKSAESSGLCQESDNEMIHS